MMHRVNAWLKRTIRHWLGIADDWKTTSSSLVGLRQDHEATVRTFHDWRRGQTAMAEQIVGTLNRTTLMAAAMGRRLSLYERTVPQVKRAKAALDAADAKAQKKAERDVKAKKLELVKEPDADAIDAQREAANEVADVG